MKVIKYTCLRRVSLHIAVLVLCLNVGFTQNNQKERLRISTSYTNLMTADDYLDIKVTARIDKETVFVPDIKLTVTTENEEAEILLGTTTTDMNGNARFVLDNPATIRPDSTDFYNLSVRFSGNDTFRKATKSVQYKKADIMAEVQTRDSINYIVATLKDVAADSVIEGESLTVQVVRLFRPLRIGEEFNFTDENGTIIVPIKNDIPGIEGNLDFRVVLSDHDEYGTVIDQLRAPIGIPIVEDTSFFRRTMWAPRNKTPLFLLIFPNLLIIAIWGIIVYLFINLFKISKN